MPAFLVLENISKYYTSAQSVVMGLNNVSLSFSLGEFVAVTGESGSGKSTIAKVMGGILPYEGGEMFVDGRPTSHYGQQDWEQYRSRRISFISQNYDILPGCSVLENVVSALVLTGMDKKKAAARAEEILEQVELLDKKKRRAAKLSSGQKQRLSIARALAKPAPVLIADEPTGNLDSENSAKVIQLLAAAAKERLVVMVTHDFEEAEDFATRHITVRDGAVESDVALREANEVSAAVPVVRGKGKGKSLGRYTAWLQMASRPVWTAILLFFFALTAFAMFAFLGTFVMNLDDSFTRVYDPSAFLNGNDNRIVVARTDKGNFTEEDYDALIAIPHVTQLERYGFLADINYYYREGIDYMVHYENVTDDAGNPTGYVQKQITMGDTNLFLQAVPYLAKGEKFLTAGRLPETMYEVVAVGGEELLGTEITIYIENKKKWPAGTSIQVEAVVVGVTDKGEHLYVAEQLGRIFTAEVSTEVVVAPIYDEPSRYVHFAQDIIFEDRYLCSASMQTILVNQFLRLYTSNGWGDLDEWVEYSKQEYPFWNYLDTENPVMLRPYGIHDSSYNGYYLVSPESFERIVPDAGANVVSLTVSDYAYTERVLSDIHALSYPAISPYQLGATKQDPVLAAERLQTLEICILAFLAVFLLQIFVLRAMFGMQTGEFRLLANLGLRCRTAKCSIVWQVVLFTAGGQLIAFAAVLCCMGLSVGRILDIVKYLPARHVLFFMVLHLATGLLTSLWIQRLIGRQVYPGTLRYADLKMDEEEAEL